MGVFFNQLEFKVFILVIHIINYSIKCFFFVCVERIERIMENKL